MTPKTDEYLYDDYYACYLMAFSRIFIIQANGLDLTTVPFDCTVCCLYSAQIITSGVCEWVTCPLGQANRESFIARSTENAEINRFLATDSSQFPCEAGSREATLSLASA